MPPCPGCGLTIEASAAYCPTCGWRAPAAQSRGAGAPDATATDAPGAADPRRATDSRGVALGEVWAGADPSPGPTCCARPRTGRG